MPDFAPSVTSAELRARREGVGLSRNALAGRVGCSVATLANAELGYVPKRSAVLARVLFVLDEIEAGTGRRSAGA